MIKLDFNPTKAQLRQFGMAGGLFTAGIALLVYYSVGHFDNLYEIEGIQITLTLSIITTLMSILVPGALKPLYILLTTLTWPIGMIFSHLIMLFLYFIILTPVALIFKIIGRDALHRKLNRDAETYWEPAEMDIPMQRYFRQF